MMIHIIRNFTFSFSRKLRIPLYNAVAILHPLSNFISKTSKRDPKPLFVSASITLNYWKFRAVIC